MVKESKLLLPQILIKMVKRLLRQLRKLLMHKDEYNEKFNKMEMIKKKLNIFSENK